MLHYPDKKRRSGRLQAVLLTATGILAFILPGMAHASGSLGQINIRLSGTVVALGCTVDAGDVNKPVMLGEWATKQLKRKGGATRPVPFSLRLTGCTASGVTATFSGRKDQHDNSLLALNQDGQESASGIAVQIMDSRKKRIVMGNEAPREVIDGNGNVTLNFWANYVTTKEEDVSGGSASADTEFTLTYY